MNTVLDDDEKKLLDDFDRLCNEIKQKALQSKWRKYNYLCI